MASNYELECGHPATHPSIGTAGYGRDLSGARLCYDCCAIGDRLAMIETGKATLYLVTETDSGQRHYRSVTNWSGSLRFDGVNFQVGRHNIARRRYDLDFRGPDGHWWHGTQYGDNTQIMHCKRTKATVRNTQSGIKGVK